MISLIIGYWRSASSPFSLLCNTAVRMENPYQCRSCGFYFISLCNSLVTRPTFHSISILWWLSFSCLHRSFSISSHIDLRDYQNSSSFILVFASYPHENLLLFSSISILWKCFLFSECPLGRNSAPMIHHDHQWPRKFHYLSVFYSMDVVKYS